jgi:hypothetical protein
VSLENAIQTWLQKIHKSWSPVKDIRGEINNLCIALIIAQTFSASAVPWNLGNLKSGNMCMARLSACRVVHQQETNKRLAITAFQLSGQFSTSRKSPRPFVSEPERENFDNVCAVGFWMTALLFCVLARGSWERDTAMRYLLRLFSIADRRRWHNNSPAIIPHAAERWLAQRSRALLFHSPVLLVRAHGALMQFPYFPGRRWRFFFIVTQGWRSTFCYFFARSGDVSVSLHFFAARTHFAAVYEDAHDLKRLSADQSATSF